MEVILDGSKCTALLALLLNNLDYLRRKGEWVASFPRKMQRILPARVAQPGATFLHLGERHRGPSGIISRSCSATAARMWTVNRFA